jgi:hypothetical protein
MKAYVLVAVLATATVMPGTALAFDWSSPSPDFEVRQKSEQLHVAAGGAMARVPGHNVFAAPIQQRRYRPPTRNKKYPDMREQVLRGYDY